MALIYPQNGDLTKSLKSSRKKVPQSARLSAGGGGAKAKRAMPECPQHEFEGCFPNVVECPDQLHRMLEGARMLEHTRSFSFEEIFLQSCKILQFIQFIAQCVQLHGAYDCIVLCTIALHECSFWFAAN